MTKKKVSPNTTNYLKNWEDEDLYGIPIKISITGQMILRTENPFRKKLSIKPRKSNRKTYQTLIELADYFNQQRIQISKCSRRLLCEIISRRLGIPKEKVKVTSAGLVLKDYSRRVYLIAETLLYLSMALR